MATEATTSPSAVAAAKRKELWDATAEAREVMNAKQIEKMRSAYGRALMGARGAKPSRAKEAA